MGQLIGTAMMGLGGTLFVVSLLMSTHTSVRGRLEDKQACEKLGGKPILVETLWGSMYRCEESR
jgi:hypothetical protein